MDMEKLGRNAYKYAIKNAFLHSGKADIKALVGKMLALEKGLDVKKAMPVIEEAVRRVNGMPPDEIEKEYKKFEEEGYELKPKDKVEGLQELEWAAKEKVVTRYAPNPNGPLHLGNARAAILSYEYAAKYGGKFILRFEDTDPKVKKPMADAEEVFREDLDWLGCRPDETYFASDRMGIYYEHMLELIKKGGAYVCTCNAEKWRELIREKKGCKCREKKPKEVLKQFEKMMEHELKEGSAVLRIKTNLEDPDPSIRDWWIARIVDEPRHARVGDKYHVWPSYMFQSAVDDHLMGVTLILRGQEHAQNRTKQEFLYKYFGWKYPHAFHFGRISLEGMVLSTSKIKEGIEKGEYEGWDDPRLGTIRALRRRGFSSKAIREVIIHLGVKPSDATVEMNMLFDLNRKYVGEASRHVSFIEDPLRLDVQFAHETEVEREGGVVTLNEGTQQFLVPKKLLERYLEGEVIRLKDAYNVKITHKDALQVMGEFVGTTKKEDDIMPWLTEGDGRDAEVTLGDNSKVYGMMDAVEVNVGDILNLDRLGFARVDAIDKHFVHCYFAHR
ncbi:MAG: glutamate--tRNA ligase [Candidatus Diapherotrites archaeon]